MPRFSLEIHGNRTGGNCLDGRLKLVKASKWMVTSCESIFVECFFFLGVSFLPTFFFLLFSFLGGDISAIPYILNVLRRRATTEICKRDGSTNAPFKWRHPDVSFQGHRLVIAFLFQHCSYHQILLQQTIGLSLVAVSTPAREKKC